MFDEASHLTRRATIGSCDVVQILCDLAACGLVHRDIKAANVLLSQPWETSHSTSPSTQSQQLQLPVLKLADWGGAAHAGVVDRRKQTTGTRGESVGPGGWWWWG